RAMLALPNEELQQKVLEDVITKELNVKQTETRIQFILEALNEAKAKKPRRISFSKDVRLAVNTIRQSVDMVMGTGMNIVKNEQDYEDRYEIIITSPKSK